MLLLPLGDAVVVADVPVPDGISVGDGVTEPEAAIASGPEEFGIPEEESVLVACGEDEVAAGVAAAPAPVDVALPAGVVAGAAASLSVSEAVGNGKEGTVSVPV